MQKKCNEDVRLIIQEGTYKVDEQTDGQVTDGRLHSSPSLNLHLQDEATGGQQLPANGR